MNEITLRTIDVLSRAIDKPISINKLVQKIRKQYGTAHYKQVYDEIKRLESNDEINIMRAGNATFPFLNFKNPLLIDRLVQVESELKIRFLQDQKEFELIISELVKVVRKYGLISSMIITDPVRNANLNRIELIIILNDVSSNDKSIAEIREMIETVSALYTVRTDTLFLQENNLINLLKDDDANIAKNIFTDKIIISNPQNFWMMIKSMLDDKIQFSTSSYETNPVKTSEKELVYNLARFGYTEFGNTLAKEIPIRIEYIITTILYRGDARHMEAIPIILAKTKNVVHNLLLFLSQKYGTSSKLLGVLIESEKYKCIVGVKTMIENLQALEIKEFKVNFMGLEKKLRTYHVIR